MDCDIAENIIEIQDANFQYKGSEEGLLENLSLSVRKGETLLLTGASGSGKTTIIRLINGLIPHYYQGDFDGKVMVSGLDVGQIELYDLAGIVGTVFQNPRSQFFSVDTDGEIVFGPENVGLDPKEILRRKQMVVSQMQIDKLLGRSLFELSGGEKQSIACASVSALLPDIILLDEPSSNLDQEAIEKLKLQIKQWKEQGKTIIISEHRLWYLRELVDRVIYMKAGRIAHEWTGQEFQAMSNEEARELKLRPLNVPDLFGDNREEKKGDKREEKEEKKEVTECEKIHNDVNEAGTSADNALILKDFYFSYLKKPHLLWKKKVTEQDEQLSLHIPGLELPMGAVIGVVGRNGMGKSTFLKCICGLEKDCKGVIEFEGKEYKAKDRLKLCYMVMQDVNHQLFTDSVEAEVLLSMKESSKSEQGNGGIKGITSDESKRITNDDCKGRLSGNREEVCDRILDELGILPYKDKHPMALSGGQKQRVAIASAIAADAKLLLFDEPTSGLDFSHMEKVGKLLKQLAASGRTVFVVTHDPELIELSCDYLLCIKNGRVKYMERIEQKSPNN